MIADREEMKARLLARRERDGEADGSGFADGGGWPWIGFIAWPAPDGKTVVVKSDPRSAQLVRLKRGDVNVYAEKEKKR